MPELRFDSGNPREGISGLGLVSGLRVSAPRPIWRSVRGRPQPWGGDSLAEVSGFGIVATKEAVVGGRVIGWVHVVFWLRPFCSSAVVFILVGGAWLWGIPSVFAAAVLHRRAAWREESGPAVSCHPEK